MPSFEKNATLPYTPYQLYTLVNDTTSYPHFVPYCLQGQVEETHHWGGNRHADLWDHGPACDDYNKKYTTTIQQHPHDICARAPQSAGWLMVHSAHPHDRNQHYSVP